MSAQQNASAATQSLRIPDEPAASRHATNGVEDFAKVYALYEQRVYRHAYLLLGDPDEADDVKQETFVRAFRHRGSFRGDCGVLSWLLRICGNLCADRRRQRRWRDARSQSLAVGISPSVAKPDNAKANAALSRDPDLARTMDVEPRCDCGANEESGGRPMVTTADLLEAFHRATRRNVVGDFFTRLYPQSEVTLRNTTAYTALNRLCDAVHMRWSLQDGWLRFRTVSYFNDRLKEVPNGLLTRWSASRKRLGYLTPADLMEMAQLTDPQLDSPAVAEGARRCYGLEEWGDVSASNLRPHWRFLAALPRALQQAATSDRGVAFEQMPVALQERFVHLVFFYPEVQQRGRLDDLAGATLQFSYNPPHRNSAAPTGVTAPPNSAKTTSETDRPGPRFTYEYGGVHIDRIRYYLAPTQSGSQLLAKATAP